MLSKLAIVTVYCSSQDAARDFWRDRCGFEVRDDAEFMPGVRWVTVGPPGGQTSFTLWPVGGPYAEGKTVGGMTGMSFECDDAQATHDEFARRGVQITQPLNQQPWGLSFMFADQDGNLFNVVQTASES